jgi:DNA-binding transcriptional LysR family regulator
MLDTRRLRVLVAVARAGSLAGAADALGYSASAISQQVAALERETAFVLLERRARGVVLTEAGRILVQHAETILADVDAAELALAELRGSRGGRLRISAFPTVAATVLPPAVDAFRARLPGVAMQVREISPNDAVTLVRRGELDLALTLDLTNSAGLSVEVFDLFDDPVQVALHRDHPLARREELRLGDLARETWIDVPRGKSGSNLLARACERAGFVPSVAFESDDYAVIGELVGSGVGVALLPDLARRPREESVTLVSLGPDAPRRTIQVVAQPAASRSGVATAMLEVLIAQAANHGLMPQAASGLPPRR